VSRTVLYLARHGETAWNAVGKLQGHTDIPLNDAGRAQARALARRLEREGIASVTTSDLTRAAETGTIVAETLGIAARHVDPALRERSFGIFEGLTRDECATRHPEPWRAWVEQTITPDGAESREAAVARMLEAVRRVVTASSGEPSLIVSHGGSMRLLLVEWLGVPVAPITNGAVYRVEVTADVFTPAPWE
jgi:broad specificity phosphatase PhoE